MHVQVGVAHQSAGHDGPDLDVRVLLEPDQHAIGCAAGLTVSNGLSGKTTRIQAVDSLGSSVVIQLVSVHVAEGEVAGPRIARIAIT